MRFSSMKLARDLFDGKVNAVASIGAGKIDDRPGIPFVGDHRRAVQPLGIVDATLRIGHRDDFRTQQFLPQRRRILPGVAKPLDRHRRAERVVLEHRVQPGGLGARDGREAGRIGHRCRVRRR